MKYKIWDTQLCQYFWQGHIFNSKAEIVDNLADFHDIDYEGLDDEGNYIDGLEKYLKEIYPDDIDKQLEWLLDYGEWEIEEVN